MSRGPIATVEIGVEVKVLAKAMIKQIDRVKNDLRHQVTEFKLGGGSPICIAVVGINQAESMTSYVMKVTGPGRQRALGASFIRFRRRRKQSAGCAL